MHQQHARRRSEGREPPQQRDRARGGRRLVLQPCPRGGGLFGRVAEPPEQVRDGVVKVGEALLCGGDEIADRGDGEHARDADGGVDPRRHHLCQCGPA